MKIIFEALFVDETIIKGQKSGKEIQFINFMEVTGGNVKLMQGKDTKVDVSKLRQMVIYHVEADVKLSNFNNQLSMSIIQISIKPYGSPADQPGKA